MKRHLALAAAAGVIAAGAALAQNAPPAASGAEDAGNQTLVRDLLGATVRTTSGDDVGELRDLVVADGEIVSAVLSIGGFAGLGEKIVAVPYEELDRRGDDDALVIARTEAELEALPQFQAPADPPAARASGSAASGAPAQAESPPPPAPPLEVNDALAEIDPRLATGVAANEEAFGEEIDPEPHDTDDGSARDHAPEETPER